MIVTLASAALRKKKTTDQGKDNADLSMQSTHEHSSYMKAVAMLELKMLTDIWDPVELKDNFLDNFSTVAVIGSLFGGANLASFMSGIDVDDHGGFGQTIGAVRFMAAGGGLTSALYSSVIMAMINALPEVISFKYFSSLFWLMLLFFFAKIPGGCHI